MGFEFEVIASLFLAYRFFTVPGKSPFSRTRIHFFSFAGLESAKFVKNFSMAKNSFILKGGLTELYSKSFYNKINFFTFPKTTFDIVLIFTFCN